MYKFAFFYALLSQIHTHTFLWVITGNCCYSSILFHSPSHFLRLGIIIWDGCCHHFEHHSTLCELGRLHLILKGCSRQGFLGLCDKTRRIQPPVDRLWEAGKNPSSKMTPFIVQIPLETLKVESHNLYQREMFLPQTFLSPSYLGKRPGFNAYSLKEKTNGVKVPY